MTFKTAQIAQKVYTFAVGTTESKIEIPFFVKRVMIRLRDQSGFRVAFTEGETADTKEFITAGANGEWLDLQDIFNAEQSNNHRLTLYIKADAASKVAEVLVWKAV